MSRSNEQYAYFTITGAFDPDEITRRATVKPTEAWRAGDLHPRSRRERRFSRWSLRSRLDEEAELEAHIRDVLGQLDEHEAIFKELSRELGGCLQLVGYFYEDYPGLHFDRHITMGLARYELAVDFDFYYLRSGERDDT